jgi:hypothetical protein
MKGQQQSFNHFAVYQNEKYRVVEILEGNHGGKLVKLKRWDQSQGWGIPRTEAHGVAPPGNPLKFIAAMPRTIVEFFQFKMFDENNKQIYNMSEKDPTYLVIPDVFEINGALKALDGMLIDNGYEGLPFRYYLESGLVSDHAFLTNYLLHLALPFSTQNEVAYHDMNYHLIPFLIFNKKIIELSQIHTSVFLKFTDWLKENYPKAATPELIRKVLAIRSNHIDNTGNLHLMLANPNFLPHHGPAVRAVKGFIGWGKSPFDYLALTFDGVWKNSPDPVFKQVTFTMLIEFAATLPPPYLNRDPVSASFFTDLETVQKNIKLRLREVRFAIMGLSKKELEDEKKKYQNSDHERKKP